MIFDELDTLGAAKTKIKVIGVGGAGKNAIDHMIDNSVSGVEFYAVNTDAQDLKVSKAPNKLLIGKTKTHGQGAGANPDVGRAAALESEDDIHEMVEDAQMVFITCGMGGGTGTGAAPIIAKVAREHDCLTIGICTKPFAFEGPIRAANAFRGLEEMRKYSDTVIVVPNERLLATVDCHTTMLDAFREADTVLRKAVQGVSEIITIPGTINLDFADIRQVMHDKGTALLGIGSAKGPNRAIEAARLAIHSRLLEVTIDGATDAVVNISASEALALKEVESALAEIRNNCSKDLNIIYGTAINSDLGDEMVITVVATGFELKAKNNGIDDLADSIFKNISEESINLNYLSSEDEEEASAEKDNHLSDVFSTGMTKREEKRRQKEEESKRKQEEARRKQEERQKVDSSSTSKSSSLPDWLKRKK